MFERLFVVIKAAVLNLLGKVEDPAVMLEMTHQGMRSEIAELRQKVAQMIATEEQMKLLIAKAEDQKEEYAALEKELKKFRLQLDQARSSLTKIENELQKADNKKQMLMQRNNFVGHPTPPQASLDAKLVLRMTLVLLALFVAAAIYLLIKKSMMY